MSYAWAGVDRPGGLDTAAWCNEYKVEALASIEELVEKSDYILILSPDNPEQHEELPAFRLCQYGYGRGKRLY